MTLLILFTSRMIWAASTEVDTVTLGNYTYFIDESNNLLIQSETDWDSLAAYVAKGNNCAGLSFLMTNDLGKEQPVTS